MEAKKNGCIHVKDKEERSNTKFLQQAHGVEIDSHEIRKPITSNEVQHIG
ncbi:hypothetical protein EUX98_g675 [Antrodiella citrinella]|uniref:Uncharacterized protein n=1 Tax=Antrodiella citrinella TaxID=2447956 RepID=A0A4S4N3H8_9APHY|nr:hypothetical protein EUX98_g675 [Antrodiella citrinella]